MKLNQSKHARKRAQQRGFRKSDLDAINQFAVEIDAGEGCRRLYIPRKVIDELVNDGSLGRQEADRIARKYKIQSADLDITVANDCGSNKKNYKRFSNGKPMAILRGKRVMGFY